MARGEWQRTTDLIDVAAKILSVEHPMTVRQLFYRLVSTDIIENCLRDYQRVTSVMTKAREDGRGSYAWIVDRSRASYSSRGWKNLADLGEVIEETLVGYRRDYWQDQPHYVEIWCEKDAVTGSIEEIREEYGLSVEAIRGFNSTSNVHAAATRLYQQQRAGKKITILYLGDWDPSGKDIERDLSRRLKRDLIRLGSRLGNDIDGPDADIDVKRIAIFKEDITRFNLPPLRVKDKDPRASQFKKRHGDEAVELDALPPTELRDRLRRAIDDLIDREAWDRAKLVESAQRETCVRYASLFKRMAAGEHNDELR